MTSVLSASPKAESSTVTSMCPRAGPGPVQAQPRPGSLMTVTVTVVTVAACPSQWSERVRLGVYVQDVRDGPMVRRQDVRDGPMVRLAAGRGRLGHWQIMGSGRPRPGSSGDDQPRFFHWINVKLNHSSECHDELVGRASLSSSWMEKLSKSRYSGSRPGGPLTRTIR